MERLEKLLADIKRQVSDILGDNLIGIYVHGSIALKSFNWDTSDVDFMVITEDTPSLDIKVRLMQAILDIDAGAPQKGLEMSVALRKDCLNLTYPYHFELHYSRMHAERAKKDTVEYCKGMRGEDPDLAAHYTVIRQSGIVLCGAPIEEVFAPVPMSDYMESLHGDMCEAKEDIMGDPVYVILNLCRTVAFIADGTVRSKLDGGRWALANLDAKYAPLIDSAVKAYTDAGEFDPESFVEMRGAFADDMLKRIFP